MRIRREARTVDVEGVVQPPVVAIGGHGERTQGEVRIVRGPCQHVPTPVAVEVDQMGCRDVVVSTHAEPAVEGHLAKRDSWLVGNGEQDLPAPVHPVIGKNVVPTIHVEVDRKTLGPSGELLLLVIGMRPFTRPLGVPILVATDRPQAYSGAFEHDPGVVVGKSKVIATVSVPVEAQRLFALFDGV